MLIWLRYLDRVIRGDATRPSALRQGDIEQPVGGLAILGAMLGAIYGLCMACFTLFQGRHDPLLQAIATVLKVPVLFFLTLAVTFPSLYVFNALVGSRLSMQSVLRLLVISLTVMLTVLASLGPIIAFFSASTTSYPFMLLLNVVIFAVSGSLGLRYMLTTLQRLTQALAAPPLSLLPRTTTGADIRTDASPFMDPLCTTNSLTADPLSTDLLTSADPLSPSSGALESPAGQRTAKEVRTVFRVWVMVFGLVGAQMGWVLRPFLGSPERAFSWFRPRESNFFEALLSALHHLFR